MEDIDYKHLHAGNGEFPSDIQKVELIIYWGNRKTHLETAMDSHTEVGKMLYWIDSTYKRVKLKPATNSLNFATILQLDPRITHHQ
uniref:hypothetical protein n=1 Tax=Mucilaginibacter sp. Bleaf8 TaxID=2834430 RepID=UPI001BCD2D54|nr:hypothetical protein [Mucilaginibacter sp. Bleaf8]